MSRGDGTIYQRKDSRFWWASYYVQGKRYSESTGHTDKDKARAYLRERQVESNKGLLRRPGRATFAHLKAGLVGHYRRNRRKSIKRVERALVHLERHLGHLRAQEITTAVARAYTEKRLEEKAAPATINRELAALRKALRLAHADRIISELPALRECFLAEDNVRRGFLSDKGYAKLRAELPPHLRPLLDAGYVTGWRKSELLSRKWSHIELAARSGQIIGGRIRLEPGETKNKRGREFPLVGPLLTAIAEQLEQKEETEKRTGRIIEPLFFHYGTGKAVRDFYGSWRKATEAAGVGGLLFHDLRRSAARNLIRAGVSEREAMELLGHRTRSIFDRYAIVDDAMLRSAGARLGAFYGDHQEPAERLGIAVEGGGSG